MTNAPGPFRGAPVAATATGPSLRWRFGVSSWLLLLLVGGGGLAWLGFGILAVIARRRSWGIFAGAYAVAAIIVQLPDDPAGHIMQGTLYLVVLVHGLIINQGWLLLLWGRRENGLTVFGNPRGARNAAPTGPRQRAAAIPKEAERLLGGGGTSRSDYVDDSAAAAPAPRARRPTRAQRRAQEDAAARAGAPTRAPVRTLAEPVAEAELVDVNTANQRTLAKLTGFDRGLAKAAITERTRRGGFGSLEDFAATAGLQPHEIVRLRGEAFCSARPRAKRSFGRRVDY
ncbi:ComEA family DNA-binding protein [Cryobacterium sp. AP23]